MDPIALQGIVDHVTNRLDLIKKRIKEAEQRKKERHAHGDEYATGIQSGLQLAGEDEKRALEQLLSELVHYAKAAELEQK